MRVADHEARHGETRPPEGRGAEGCTGAMRAVAADELGVGVDRERHAAQGLAVGARVGRGGRAGAEHLERRDGRPGTGVWVQSSEAPRGGRPRCHRRLDACMREFLVLALQMLGEGCSRGRGDVVCNHVSETRRLFPRADDSRSSCAPLP